MASLFNEGYEGGAVGAALSTANTSHTSASSFSGWTFQNTTPLPASSMGSRYAEITAAAGVSRWLTSAFTSTPLLFWRAYVYVPSGAGGNVDFATVRGSGTSRARLGTNGDGTKFVIRDGTSVVWTSTVSVPTGAWFRLEWRLASAAGQQQLRIFTGANLHGATATEDSGNQTLTAGAYDEVRTGPVTNTLAGTWVCDYDGVAADNAIWVGPAVIPNTSPTVNAGADQTNVEPWTTVTLTGTATDPDGTIVTRGWSQTGGSPTVELSGTGATVTFDAPATNAGTTLTFTFSATDDDGATSTDSMTVTVLQATEHAAVGGVVVPVRFVQVEGTPVDPDVPGVPIVDLAAPLTRHEWSMWSRTPDYGLNVVLPILSTRFVRKHMGVNHAVCETPFTAQRWASLQPGCGVVMFRDGRQEFTGRLVDADAEWDATRGYKVITVQAEGDGRGLQGRNVFPDPLRAADDQTVNDYWTKSGVPASTAMLALISDQAGPTCRSDRRIPGLVLGDDPGIGVTRTWKARNNKVMDQLALMSVASGANLGLRATSEAGQLEFTIYEPRDVADRIIFSADLSNLVGFKHHISAPKVTHAVAGGKGDLHLRLQKTYATTNPLALAWGEQQWEYVDRRDTDDTTELLQAATDAVTEGAPTVSLTVTLTDSQAATYGRDWGLGDKVTVWVGFPGEPKEAVADVVREILFEVDNTGAEKITPAIGSYDAKAILPTPTEKQLARVGAALGQLKGN